MKNQDKSDVQQNELCSQVKRILQSLSQLHFLQKSWQVLLEDNRGEKEKEERTKLRARVPPTFIKSSCCHVTETPP